MFKDNEFLVWPTTKIGELHSTFSIHIVNLKWFFYIMLRRLCTGWKGNKIHCWL